MPSLEDELARLELEIEDAQKSAKALASALAKVKTAAQAGVIADIEKGLGAVAQRGEEARAAAARLSSSWVFDAKAHLENGYTDELRVAARAVGLDIIDRDGRLSVFPILLKLEPKDLGVRLGKRLERKIRPSALANALLALQNKPQRFREQSFLDLLYKTYRHVCGRDWKDGEAHGPVKALTDLHATLTLLPESDYPLPEFGRDLLLLDRKPDLRTRDGVRIQFEGSTIARERIQRINVYDERGMQHVYIGVRFVKGE